MSKKQYSPNIEFQVTLVALSGDTPPVEIAKQCGINPNSVWLWKKEALQRGAEGCAQGGAVQQYERLVVEFAQLMGKRKPRSPC